MRQILYLFTYDQNPGRVATIAHIDTSIIHETVRDLVVTSRMGNKLVHVL